MFSGEMVCLVVFAVSFYRERNELRQPLLSEHTQNSTSQSTSRTTSRKPAFYMKRTTSSNIKPVSGWGKPLAETTDTQSQTQSQTQEQTQEATKEHTPPQPSSARRLMTEIQEDYMAKPTTATTANGHTTQAQTHGQTSSSKSFKTHAKPRGFGAFSAPSGSPLTDSHTHAHARASSPRPIAAAQGQTQTEAQLQLQTYQTAAATDTSLSITADATATDTTDRAETPSPLLSVEPPSPQGHLVAIPHGQTHAQTHAHTVTRGAISVSCCIVCM